MQEKKGMIMIIITHNSALAPMANRLTKVKTKSSEDGEKYFSSALSI